jgi:ribosomal protein L11 methyltransferase
MATPDPAEDTAGKWIEVSVEADSESVEAVTKLMSRYAYGQGVVVFEQYRQDPDGDNLIPDPTRPVTVVVYLPAGDEAETQIQRLEEGLWHLRQIGHVGPVLLKERPEEDWAHAWKEHFQVLRIGKRFVIRPTWRSYEPRPDDLVIDLDPGMAFGTGHHPTTELCLQWLEELPVDGKRVLDVGAGSGILSVAAQLLNASEVDAVEIDEVAARVLRENLEMNGVGDTVHVHVGDFADGVGIDEQYDLVIANIISSVLIRLAEPLVRSVGSGGQLLLSGVIDQHLERVRQVFTEHRMNVIRERRIGDWYALLLEHNE